MAMYDSLRVPVLGFHNPAGSTFYPNGLYTYAIGNTRGRDLTETFGTKKGQHLDLLLLASGDVRNVLFTISEMSLRKAENQPKSISFHLNDYDPSVVARNVVILELADTINPEVPDDIDFLWDVWYNMALSKSNLARLREVLASLIKRDFDGGDSFLKFQENVLQECRDIWMDWREIDLDVNSVKQERNEVISKKAATAVLLVNVTSKMMMAPSNLSELPSAFSQEIEHWFLEGSTNDELASVNPTLIRPFVHKWMVHYSACVFEGYLPFQREELLRCGLLTAACKDVLKLLVKRYQRLKYVMSIQVISWTCDGLWLCTSGLPKDLLFDVIDTSNVGDHIGLLNVLVCCGARLKSSLASQLFTSSITWCGFFESIEEYYNKCVGVHPYLLPTILGLKLAVDFDLGSRTLPDKLETSVEILCWVKAESTRSLLKIDESSDIVQGLYRIAERCFKLDEEVGLLQYIGAYYSSPITLLRIIQQLYPLIDGGAAHILDLLHGKLPFDFDQKYGLSWNLIKASIANKQEHIVEVEVRVDCSAVSLDYTPMPKIIIHNQINDDNMFPWQSIFGLCIPAERVKVIYNSARYDMDRQVVIFHLLENDWDELKEKSWLKIESNDYLPLITSETVFLGKGGATLSVTRVDPVTTFGLSSAQIFNVCTSQEETHVLEVIKIEESENSYKAELAMRDPSKCQTANMKINYLPESCPTAFDISFGKVIGCIMYFSCSIEKYSKFQVSRKQGKITCQIPKNQDGTAGELVLRNPAPIPFHALPRWKTEVHNIGLACFRMFRTKVDMQLKIQGRLGNIFHNLRETIAIILHEQLKHPEKIKIFTVIEQRLIDGHYEKGRLTEARKYGIKVEEIYLWKCIPIAKVIFFNITGPETAQIMEFFVREVLPYQHHPISASKEEFDLFEKMLKTNAARTTQENKSNSIWRNSFISTIFPRNGMLNVFGMAGLLKSMTKTSVPQNLLESNSMPSQHVLTNTLSNWYGGVDMDLCSGQLSETECSYCHKISENLKRCMRCKKAFYCNKDCQQRHWKLEHKTHCQKS